MKKVSYLVYVFLTCLTSFGQENEIPNSLKIDSSFAFIQGYSNESLKKFKAHFDNVEEDKVVILHYGGSHIQAENPTTVARQKFHDQFGDGGRGLMFNYGAANTYSSINYKSTCSGKWRYNKSFQGRKADLPLGICGMVVETTDSIASLDFKLKNEIEKGTFQCFLFFENDSLSHDFQLLVNNQLVSDFTFYPHGAAFSLNDSISDLRIDVIKKENSSRFRFYGINIENEKNEGVVYHSTGVGAAAFRSILWLDKLPEQIPVIKPDIVILDFGTNDILYYNKIDKNLVKEVEKSIHMWRELNPEVQLILTSTQDLYYKKRYITAGISFRDLMDSLARANDCLFWNWYDLSGGINTIRTWYAEGFAQKDCVHLTKKGYKVKGGLIYESFVNTLQAIEKNDSIQELTVPLKDYSTQVSTSQIVNNNPPQSGYKTYVVKKGDTLSEIALRNRTTVSKIKSLNKLKSDRIQIGQQLKLPIR